ncbi:MAG: fumarylacetoacetate hydrolase family protein [Lachnospiraceae bacterium]|nr:fumarylacetoacetate hydrolase family protein [Lachnospiraceae bacterium]
MKFLTYQYHGVEILGILTDKGVYNVKDFGLNYASMNELIVNITDEEMKTLKLAVKNRFKPLNFEDIKLLAPIPYPLQDVLCLGLNYADHAKEYSSHKKETEETAEKPVAVYFSKRVNKASASGDLIPKHEEIVTGLDYEVELGVVIKKDAWQVKEEEAFDYVFGYTIINDVTSRDIQSRHKQWYFGKSLDGFLPMGPVLVTEDEFERPPVLKITAKVNGELRQSSSTSLLIHGIAKVICELTKGMTLKAGTIIATGTPAGVGLGFNPPKYLKSGDVVECEIEKIGVLENTVE